MKISSVVAFVLSLALFLSVELHAQTTQSSQSFADLSDTTDAAADNASENTPGRLASVLTRLRCLTGYTIMRNTGSITLNVNMTTYKLYNPETSSYDTVNMRSYNGCPAGPTISIKPGTKLNVTLKNNLPLNPAETCSGITDPETPKCYNTTNLHTHGLHISPSGNSDNVLLDVDPQTSFNYEYDVDANHPAGTFWYHSHRHGSTAIDVASGMAGVLIIRGSRTAADKKARGGLADIDTILHRKLLKIPFREHVFLFQQIEYGCFQDAAAPSPITDPTTGEWACPKGITGEIRNYTTQLSFVPDLRPGHASQLNSTWVISGRYTQINGVVQPVFPSTAGFVPAGEIRRWRMVHGGNRDTINVKIVRANLSALGVSDSSALSASQINAAATAASSRLAASVNKPEQTTTLDTLCSGETVKQLEIAVDGLTRTSMVEKDVNTMNPGYRSDVLVAFPKPGLYCLLDEAASSAATINFRPNSSKVKDRRLLSIARVGPGANIPDYVTDGNGHSKYWQYIRNQLVDANSDLPQPARGDLQSLNTQTFAPIKQVAGPAKLPAVTTEFAVAVGPVVHFFVNGDYYHHDRIDHTATLGTTEEWDVDSTFIASHVFHIHTNPFQIVDILNAQRVSIFDSQGNCTADESATDQEYCSLHNVVRDTLFIKPGYQAILRTKYEDFTGEFVMHCHILDHEDRGMMQNVEIVSPTTAFLRQMATPVKLASSKAEQWFAQIVGAKSANAEEVFASSLCTAKGASAQAFTTR